MKELYLTYLNGVDVAHLAMTDAEILDAVEAILVEGPHTPDLGGKAKTTDLGKAIADAVSHAR